MRRLTRFVSAFAAILGIAVLVFIFFMRDRYVVPILMYHHVADFKNHPFLNTVTPKTFAWQMKFIEKHHYKVISFDDYVQAAQKGLAFARNTVVIEFDDGYEDNYTNAFPVLKEYRFPAMVFLVADKIGEEGFLTWDQMREMETRGFMAGAHTLHHVYLPEVPPDVAHAEIFGSKKVLEDHLGHRIDYFNYPSGGFNDTVEGLVQEAGFQAAATTNRGPDRFNRNLFELNRIRIKNTDSGLILWAKLSGYYNLFRAAKCGSGKCSGGD